jgi:tRNA (adenine37-N6)-methyltransferase
MPALRVPDGPICRIEVSEPWVAGLDGIKAFERLEVLYWLHQSGRDLVRQSPGNDGATKGTFTLVSREGPALNVRGLDCVDGTPLLDLKPDRSQFRSGGAGS